MAKVNNKSESFEKTLFKTADKLRKNMDAAEYKHIVLGLIFLKYISDSFEELHGRLKEGKGDYKGADPEDADEYRAENVFFVPPAARWFYLHARAKQPSIGKDVDDAMGTIEKENPTLKGILPKVYARPNLDKAALGGLIDLIGNIALGTEAAKSKDILGRVYEYFLGEFANAEGKKGGQFYTHRAFTEEDIAKLAGTYHEWRSKYGRYEDIKGFCKSAGMEEIRKHNYVLTPGRYVEIKEEEDDGIPFEEKMAGFLGELREQMAEEKRLNKEIEKQLSNIGFDLENV